MKLLISAQCTRILNIKILVFCPLLVCKKLFPYLLLLVFLTVNWMCHVIQTDWQLDWLWHCCRTSHTSLLTLGIAGFVCKYVISTSWHYRLLILAIFLKSKIRNLTLMRNLNKKIIFDTFFQFNLSWISFNTYA